MLFTQLGGVPIGKLSDAAMEQAQLVLHEYRDIIYEMPFQFPTDMLFAMRAVAILSGMATSLDPDFDPWAATLPFAQRMAGEQGLWNWRSWVEDAAELARLAVRLPGRMDRFLAQAERGELVVQYSLAPDAAKAVRRIERSVDRLTWGVVSVGLLVAGVVLRASEGASPLSTGLLVAAAGGFSVGSDPAITDWWNDSPCTYRTSPQSHQDTKSHKDTRLQPSCPWWLRDLVVQDSVPTRPD